MDHRHARISRGDQTVFAHFRTAAPVCGLRYRVRDLFLYVVHGIRLYESGTAKVSVYAALPRDCETDKVSMQLAGLFIPPCPRALFRRYVQTERRICRGIENVRAGREDGSVVGQRRGGADAEGWRARRNRKGVTSRVLVCKREHGPLLDGYGRWGKCHVLDGNGYGRRLRFCRRDNGEHRSGDSRNARGIKGEDNAVIAGRNTFRKTARLARENNTRIPREICLRCQYMLLDPADDAPVEASSKVMVPSGDPAARLHVMIFCSPRIH